MVGLKAAGLVVKALDDTAVVGAAPGADPSCQRLGVDFQVVVLLGDGMGQGGVSANLMPQGWGALVEPPTAVALIASDHHIIAEEDR